MSAFLPKPQPPTFTSSSWTRPFAPPPNPPLQALLAVHETITCQHTVFGQEAHLEGALVLIRCGIPQIVLRETALMVTDCSPVSLSPLPSASVILPVAAAISAIVVSPSFSFCWFSCCSWPLECVSSSSFFLPSASFRSWLGAAACSRVCVCV
jgi:hypothetical protein